MNACILQDQITSLCRLLRISALIALDNLRLKKVSRLQIKLPLDTFYLVSARVNSSNNNQVMLGIKINMRRKKIKIKNEIKTKIRRKIKMKDEEQNDENENQEEII